MVLENTSLFFDLDQAVHQLAERMMSDEDKEFLIVVLSQDAMPVADQMAKRLGVNIIFSPAARNTETTLNPMSVVSFDYTMINQSGRDIPQDFIFHQEQNLRTNLISIYADAYESLAVTFPGKIVILVDELTNNGTEFFPSLAKEQNEQAERISLSIPENASGITQSIDKTSKRFVFLHLGKEASGNEVSPGFDMIIERVGTDSL